ncbi:MAG: aminotransferase class V-fold PLP-dependent enzyme, partial [Bacilli bacterium]|nr:aminotransferase class V-fold PLP-dependent enzyme [Bacilli bacterium]
YPKIVFHVDACQAIGKMEKEFNYKNVDMFTVAAHKLGGIIGTAALIKKKNLELLPLFSGGGQEYGLRSSTVNVAGAVAFLEALKISLKKDKEHYDAVKLLANHLLDGLKEMEDNFELNVPETINPYIINFSSKNKKSSVIVEALGNAGIMVSSTSACHSSKQKGSYVVKAIGKSDIIANNTIRVSFSYDNTFEEVDTLLTNLKKIIGEIR